MNEDLTYYEILEVAPDASFSEIRSAFREIQSIYDKESLSTYSLFSPKERLDILTQAQQAFETLVDREKRLAYDKLLTKAGKLTESMGFAQKPKTPEPVFKTAPSGTESQASKDVKKKVQASSFLALKEEFASKDNVTGAGLKRLRQAGGVTLVEIFEMSRVSVATLEAIESDQLHKLPPAIYLKGFLKAYAECLGLDPVLIVPAYMENLSHNS